MDTKTLVSAIEQICEEKNISKEQVIETIEIALAAAYKKEYDRKGQNIEVKLDPKTGNISIFQIKTVLDQSMLKTEDEIEQEKKEKENQAPAQTQNQENTDEKLEKKVRFNPEKHIMKKEIKKNSKKKYQPGDEIKFPLEVTHDFGRIAAQTAKQVIIQRIREAERDAVFEEYKEKEGEIVSGVIQRIEKNTIFLDIGKATGIIFPEEQIRGERYQIGQRLKALITEIQKEARGPAINLSRAHPKMVSQLFQLEVPEILAGTIEIKTVAREAGSRSKISVISNEERIDPIGSMIGQKGTRVQAVINELNGEKIDIIQWSEDPAIFIANSLSPAKINEVKINSKKNHATIIVPEDQLSLAIGAKGQNVRLAAKLTSWKIDILAQKPTGEIKTAGVEGKAKPEPEQKKEKTKKKKQKKETTKAKKKSPKSTKKQKTDKDKK